MPTPPKDRFDDMPPSPGRVGAHRAENPKVAGWSTLLWAAGATIVLIVAGIFATMAGQGRIALFPEAVPTFTPSPTVPAVIDTTYSVLVLNGTPEEGLATRMKETLIAQGWPETNVLASNAGDRAFPLTTVYYAAPEAESAARGLAGVVGADTVELDPGYPLPGTPVTQLTVVIGLDEPSPQPSPEPAP